METILSLASNPHSTPQSAALPNIASFTQENHILSSQTSLSITPNVTVSIAPQSIPAVDVDTSQASSSNLSNDLTGSMTCCTPGPSNCSPTPPPATTQNATVLSGSKSLIPPATTSQCLNEAQLPPPTKKGKRATAGKGMNGKSLCKREWIAKHSNGLEDEFATYWSSLVASGESKGGLSFDCNTV
ncbi:hypothetical protein C0995_008151 [Termitomyces sp. Mi166|nr:hypothetical protein C0995_008151 [Termitomyces sp. Mi166\